MKCHRTVQIAILGVNRGKAMTNSREIHPIIMDGIRIKIVGIKNNLRQILRRFLITFSEN